MRLNRHPVSEVGPIPTRIHLALLLVLTLTLAAGKASAQVAVYGMGSGAFLGSGSSSGGFSSFGYTVGLYDDLVRLGPLKLGGDVRYLQGTSSGSNNHQNKVRGGLLGPRLSLALPLVPFKPYLQAEVGDVATNYGTLSNLPNSFAYQIQGGLDFTVFPHLDLRAEYAGGQIRDYGSGGFRTLQGASFGLVVRF